MTVNDSSVLEEEAAELIKKTEQEGLCKAVGEGENCW